MMTTHQMLTAIDAEDTRLHTKYGPLSDSFQASAHVRRAYLKAEVTAFDKASTPEQMRDEWLHLAAVCLRAATTVDPENAHE